MTTSFDAAQVADLFALALEAGEFDNAIEQYLDDNFRSLIRDTFYSQTLKEEGKEVAEAALHEWATVRTSQEVADSLAPIAASLAQLARVCHQEVSVKVLAKTDKSMFPFPRKSSHSTFAIVVNNPIVLGCACNQPRGAHKFSPHGELGITSYVVVIDPFDQRNNSIVLMLPVRDEKPGQNGAVALILSRNGTMESRVFDVILYKNGAESLVFGIDQPYRVSSISGASPCQFVGFPGAQEYITSSLKELPEYLAHVALELSGEHGH